MIPHVEPYITSAERKAVNAYMKSGGYLTEFKHTERFERMLALFLGVPHVSMVPNGTSALYLSLLAAGIGKGDKVLVPDFTMIATANAVRMTGAEVVLVDINAYQCMDLQEAEEAMAYPDKQAMIYVSINGRSQDMRVVKKFCKEHNLILIEDACQSLGSINYGKKLGTFGRFGCFSLGFHKIITTGQGGFIVTHNEKDYEAIERLKDFGRVSGGNDIHNHIGYNFKYTDLQAVIGIEQLATIDWRMEKKRELFEWYHGEQPPKGYVPWFIEHWCDNPKEVKDHLEKNDIQSRLLYPPIHSQEIYPDGDYPNATYMSSRGLWLPSSLSLTKKDVELVKKKVEEMSRNEDI